MKKAYIETYGCQMNQADSEVVASILKKDDYEMLFKGLDIYDNPTPNKNNYYVFCGDYLDRGIQNKETLEFLIELSENKNVVFIEGNHNWDRYYVNDCMDNIKSNEFLNNTLPQIKTIDKNKIGEFVSKWELFAKIPLFIEGCFSFNISFNAFDKVSAFNSLSSMIFAAPAFTKTLALYS